MELHSFISLKAFLLNELGSHKATLYNNCLKTSLLQLSGEKSVLNRVTWPVHTRFSLRCSFPWLNERQQYQNELRLEEEVLPFTNPFIWAKEILNVIWGVGIRVVITRNWILDSLLWGLREVSWEFVLTISYVFHHTGDSNSVWPCRDKQLYDTTMWLWFPRFSTSWLSWGYVMPVVLCYLVMLAYWFASFHSWDLNYSSVPVLAQSCHWFYDTALANKLQVNSFQLCTTQKPWNGVLSPGFGEILWVFHVLKSFWTKSLIHFLSVGILYKWVCVMEKPNYTCFRSKNNIKLNNNKNKLHKLLWS